MNVRENKGVSSGLKNYLIRGGKLYNPEYSEKKDILVAGGEILKIAEEISRPEAFEVEMIDATNGLIVPGFIDSHVHLTGGGGEPGFSTRIPEIPLSGIVEAGVTTVAGLLGTDNITRSPEDLLAKAKALNKTITALAYTGSYHLPSPTITESVKKDIALIDEFIGVKFAISDHRSSQPTTKELARIASQARVGGILGNKPGIVHVHVGDGSGGLDPILNVGENTEIPLSQFVPTHVGRNTALLKQGIELVQKGGYIDITCPGETLKWEEEIKSSLERIVESGVPLSHITLSSDSNGSMPEFDEEGNVTGIAKGEIRSLFRTVTEMVEMDVLSLSDALKLVTKNPARRLGIFERKGSVEEGKDADLAVLTEDLELENLLARGKMLLNGDETIAKGRFE